MLNTSDRISQMERMQILDDFSEKMLRSGYNITQVREILISGIRGYLRKLNLAKQRGTKLYRSAKSSLADRIKKKIFEKTSWYREKKNFLKKSAQNPGKKFSKKQKKSDPQNKKIKAVLFVPRTERGELLSRLKEEEAKLTDITGYRVKLVESSGTQLSRILCKRNPWAGQDCGRPDCLVCGEGEAGGGDCRRRNITYVTTCINCVKIRKEDNTAKEPARYIGESARSGYERGREHLDDYLHRREDSHMAKHSMLEHPGEEVTFKMKVLAKHKSAFERQVTEAVLIEMGDDGRLLNSKGGFNRCVLPRLQVAMGDRVVEHGRTEFSDKDNLEDGVKLRRTKNVYKRRKGARASESSNPENLRKIKKAQKMKSIISSNYKFVPLTKVFGVTDMKSKTGIGSNDWGSSNQDKRKPGEI